MRMRNLREFSAGVTGNFVHEGLADLSQQTFTFDIGTLYDVGVVGMKIGMAISNIGSQIQFIDREARIPAIFRVGTSVALINGANQKLLGSFEFSHPPDNSDNGGGLGVGLNPGNPYLSSANQAPFTTFGPPAVGMIGGEARQSIVARGALGKKSRAT